MVNFSKLSKLILKNVFLFYCTFSFLITLIYFGIEYKNAQNSVLSELQGIEATFSHSLTQALWELNQTQLEVISQGIVSLPVVEAIEILDLDSSSLVTISNSKKNIRDPEYQYSFALSKEVNERNLILGTVFLQSSSEIVFKRVRSGFILIAINSIIKTIALWYLLIFFLEKFINLPLRQFKEKIRIIKFDHLNLKIWEIDGKDENELSLLQEELIQMTNRLNAEKEELLKLKENEKVRLEEQVALRTSELQEVNDELDRLAHTDFLTGDLNRRKFWNNFKDHFESRHPTKDLFLMMMDIDYFKLINDKYGHNVGDLVLQKFSLAIKNISSETKNLARVGGEEFALYIEESSSEIVYEIAESIRRAISELKIQTDGVEISLSVSIGLARTNSQINSPEQLMKEADRLLYLAKNNGRNRVEAAE